MKPKVSIRFFAVLMTFTVMSIVYFGFGNVYSSSIFNHQDFQEQFHSGIYQYRILSGYFMEWIYQFLGSLNLDYRIFKLKFFNENAEPQMYIAFYVLNTFFAILSALMLVLITESKKFIATFTEKILIVVAGVFVIGLTQFSMSPYDNSSYFFLLVFFWAFLKYYSNSSTKNLLLLMIILFISAHNRETAALSISLSATLLYQKYGVKKQSILPVAILGLVFLTVYLGVRFSVNSFSTNDGNLLLENFTLPKNYLGMLFWLVFFSFSLLISRDKQARKNILVFHLFSLPYILMCFYSGILYEVRLYVPLFLTSTLLSRVDFNQLIATK